MHSLTSHIIAKLVGARSRVLPAAKYQEQIGPLGDRLVEVELFESLSQRRTPQGDLRAEWRPQRGQEIKTSETPLISFTHPSPNGMATWFIS